MRLCREQIKNVKNALVTCKSLLQCRRDDLKKLWAEAAEQKYFNKILSQMFVSFFCIFLYIIYKKKFFKT